MKMWKVFVGPKRIALGLSVLGAVLCAVAPYRPIVLVGISMEPTYRDGEWLWAKRFSGPASTLKRGDLVVMDSEEGPIVKRVAYLPGDSVDQVHFAFWTDEYSEATGRILHDQGKARILVIPPGTVYIRGDNPSQSMDSRQLGPIPVDRIRYVVVSPRPRQYPPTPLTLARTYDPLPRH